MRLLILFFILPLLIQPVLALDIVYPSAEKANINTNSTFVFGNVGRSSKLTINKEPVKIWDEGIFVHIVPLNKEINKINFTETLWNGKKEEKVITIYKNAKTSSQAAKPQTYIPKKEGTYLYSKTVKNHSTIRQKATLHSARITELPAGIVLYLAGRQGDYYKIDENTDTEMWIHKSNITEPVTVSEKTYAKTGEPKETQDKNYNYVQIPISHPVLYTIKQEGSELKVVLYGIYKDKNNENILNNKLSFTLTLKKGVQGYDGIYKDKNFIVRTAKIPNVNKKMALNGIRIYLDAGHGGKDKGAIGPTRVCEKDINLSIVRRLGKLLKSEGAIVFYTRQDDSFTELYERADNAVNNNVFISISIHVNSLPPNQNPYLYHGTETHYYNENAKDLAQIITNNLAEDLKIKNNGIHKSSFVMDRATNPISVLVETAYIINPEEYLKIKTIKYQQLAAESIKKSLEEYIIYLIQQNNCGIISE